MKLEHYKEQTKGKRIKFDFRKINGSIMKSNEIDCFDLKDGQICYNKKTVKKPIQKKIYLTYYLNIMMVIY